MKLERDSSYANGVVANVWLISHVSRSVRYIRLGYALLHPIRAYRWLVHGDPWWRA